MSIPVTIQGSSYNIPEQGQSAPWGSDLTSLLQAMVTVLNDVVGPADILTTSFTIANNQSSVANVTGLVFDNTEVRSAIVSYSISRSTTTTEYSECGQLMLTRNSSAGTWEMARYAVGDAGVVFSVTNAGQVQYTSSNMSSGTGYASKLKFNAKAFLQT